MEQFEFTDEYKTHLDTIDYEHQKLFRMINEIISASKLDPEQARLLIEINLDELIKYTVYHFRTEEDLMIEHKDPNYESHKKAHDALKAKAIEYKKKFDNNEDILTQLVTFLQDWLIGHIKGTDMKYVDLFKEKNVQ